MLDLPNRRLDVELTDEELAARRERQILSRRGPTLPERGFARLYVDNVTQADTGCDFDFLRRVPLVPASDSRSVEAP